MMMQYLKHCGAVQQRYNKVTQNHLNVVMNEDQRVCF